MAYTAINMLRVDLKPVTHVPNSKFKMHMKASNQNESASNLRGVTAIAQHHTPIVTNNIRTQPHPMAPSTFETHDDHMPH